MKLTYLSMVFLFISSLSNARPLMSAIRQPGLEAHPRQITVTFASTGSVVQTIKDLQTQKTTKHTLARLSQSAIEALSRSIANVPANESLVDANPKDPLCTDVPSIEVSVWHAAGLSQPIYRWRNCHEFNLESRTASQLVALAQFFLNL